LENPPLHLYDDIKQPYHSCLKQLEA